jgi:hypothetical protein
MAMKIPAQSSEPNHAEIGPYTDFEPGGFFMTNFSRHADD